MEQPQRIERPQIVMVNRSIVLNSAGLLLLIKRAAHDSHHAGRWEFPGGKLDQGQDVSGALGREVEEETGLKIMVDKPVAYYESQVLTKGKYAGLTYIVLVGVSKVEDDEVTLSEEHQDFVWVSQDEALQYDLTEESRNALSTLKKLSEV